MFEKNALIAGKVIHSVLIGVGAAWLAWIGFANLSFWLTLFLLPFAFLLMAAVGAPPAAAASFVGGLAVASIVFIRHKAFSRSRCGA